ncbi:hypothetical protein [Dyadobacter sediminis]|uniref:DUF932 domain-containing protein n=1 Tax=Dyadobacter sediminis TaxID=1493691 RepID=A0A5R9KBX9_9BACT|nr:hypothetical protein [Dyadobacter sediminis]TLU92268.1 hypothetical protein FEM55_16160 [Dyadobacter sediminis]GGB95989.1 hypothetical protein GCM10011325_24140 [Dyadobacter sediminis]
MTYISAQPHLSNSWDDICYPVHPVWLADILPDYDIMATDRQQLIVGEPHHGRKTVFGIQSADYAIIPNILIREVVDKLFSDYSLQIKHTTTGEFSISIIFPQELSIGGERLQRSMILTNSYNGKTPFSIQGQTMTTMLDNDFVPGSSMYRAICKNGLMGWADSFVKLPAYRQWLLQGKQGKAKKPAPKSRPLIRQVQKDPKIRKIHHSRLTPELFKEQLYSLLVAQQETKPTLTATVYEHFQQKAVTRSDEDLLKTLPIPVQLAKQAQERLRLEERLLGSNPSYWLMYNAVNHALFNARSSLTLNDRYKLDEQVFHQLAASSFA